MTEQTVKHASLTGRFTQSVSDVTARYVALLVLTLTSLIVGCGETQKIIKDDTQAMVELKEAGANLRRELTFEPNVDGGKDMWHAVDLRGVSVDEEILENLLTIKVTKLKIDGDVSDETMAAIAKLERITELDLADSNVSDTGLEALKDHQALGALKLNNTSVTGAGLAHLPAQVYSLQLVGVELSDDELSELVQRPQVRMLTVQQNPRLTSAGIDAAKQSRPGMMLLVRPE
jgi:hypothetical protein